MFLRVMMLTKMLSVVHARRGVDEDVAGYSAVTFSPGPKDDLNAIQQRVLVRNGSSDCTQCARENAIVADAPAS